MRKEDESDGRTHLLTPYRESVTLPTYEQGSRTSNELDSHLVILPSRRSSFTTTILAESVPATVKIPNLPKFEGTSDPQDHLDKFYVKADLYDFSDAV